MTSRHILRAIGGVLLAVGTVAPVLAQGKQDTVYRFNERTQRSQALQGKVTADKLGNLVMTSRDGDESKVDATAVIQVVWGEVPASLSEGRKLLRRGDYGAAVASLRDAAADDTYGEPVRAAARMEAVEALLAWGSVDPAHMPEAVSEAERFMADFSDSRLLPDVRALKARAAWLSGDAAAARDSFKSLYEAGKDGAQGYAPIVVADAALNAAHAALDAGDAAGAREMFAAADAAFSAVTSAREQIQQRATEGADVASLGDALAKVASGDFSGARSALERASDSKETAAARGAARLALGQAQLGLGDHFGARLSFAWVAGLDHTSADRRAAALVGMAEAILAEGGEGAADAARQNLMAVKRAYGRTPAARRAAELLAQ